MKASISLLSALLAAPLLSSVASTPISNTQSQQIVFADVEDATRLDPDARQGDLVDVMIADAKSKGQDLSAWGIQVGDEIDGGGKVLMEEGEAFLESVDLDDPVAKAKLMWEAAMEKTTIAIQPVSHLKTAAEEEIKAKVEPGSGWIWQSCGSGQEAAVLQELDVTPDPPKAGQNLTVRAKGIVNSPIHEGTYADVVVKLGFIRLLSKRFDICQLAEENDAEVKCPLEPGEYDLTHTVELPKEIPPAKFNVHVSGKTQDEVDFVCMNLSIDFMHH